MTRMLVFYPSILTTPMPVVIPQSHFAVSPASHTTRRDEQVGSLAVEQALFIFGGCHFFVFMTCSECCVPMVAVQD